MDDVGVGVVRGLTIVAVLVFTFWMGNMWNSAAIRTECHEFGMFMAGAAKFKCEPIEKKSQ